MNTDQRNIVKVAVWIFFFMILFPPFHYVYGPNFESNAGYSFILSPPEGNAEISIGKLLMEWIALAIITGASFLLAKEGDGILKLNKSNAEKSIVILMRKTTALQWELKTTKRTTS